MKELASKQIPQASGVYFFKDRNGLILYIGKAVNLKNRVKSYFAVKPSNPRIAELLEQTRKITWQETDSEIEALILESQLIKKHKPRFNVMLRDDKQYFYVGFSKERFPKIIITHRPSSYQNSPGPFTDGSALKTALLLLRRVFPYCTCRQKHNNYCLNYHIGKCLGFCCLKKPEYGISNIEYGVKTYRKNVEAIKNALTGKRASLIKSLKKEMGIFAKNKEFEKAAELRDKIEKLEKVFTNARIIQHSTFDIRYSKSAEPKRSVLKELAKLVKLNRPPMRIEGYDIANIQGKFATGAMVVFTNGQPDKSQYRKFKIVGKNQTYRHRKSLNKRLAMSQNSDSDSGGDVVMLKEVLTRRFNHPEWPWPDLIISDGGKAQLNATRSVVSTSRHRKSFGLAMSTNQIPIVALTKNEKHRGTKIFTDTKTAIPLSKLPPNVRNLILQIDAEAHRFAIGYYRKLHKSSVVN